MPKHKNFSREYEFKSDMKLYSLNEFLLNDLDFSPDQMIIFEGIDKNNKKVSKYGLFDLGHGSIDMITLEKTLSKGELVLSYIYDLNSGRHILLEFIEESEVEPRKQYPRLTAQKGSNPSQFSDEYDDYTPVNEEDISIGDEDLAEFNEE